MAMSPMCAHEAAPVASSAYQTCFTAGQCDCKLSIRIFTATAYIAMASWSPWAKILDKAKDVFTGTNINITVEGKCHLGAAIGSRKYTEHDVGEQVKIWTQEVLQLAEIATSQ